jgi:oxygen-independent coproporphyrinogen-3 oxidase
MSGGFENVGWCLPGTENRYNVCMMEELNTILSLGAGGVTKRIDPAAGSLKRIVNPKYPKEYMEQIASVREKKERVLWPTS